MGSRKGSLWAMAWHTTGFFWGGGGVAGVFFLPLSLCQTGSRTTIRSQPQNSGPGLQGRVLLSTLAHRSYTVVPILIQLSTAGQGLPRHPVLTDKGRRLGWGWLLD